MLALVKRLPWIALGLGVLLLALGAALHPEDGIYYAPIGVGFLGVGALLGHTHPGNPIGWLLLGFGLVASVASFTEQYAHHALVVDTSLPAGNLAAAVGTHIWHPGFGLFVFAFILFPEGRLLSPRWRWMAWATVVVYGGLLLSGPFDKELLDLNVPAAHPLVHGTAADVGGAVFGALLIANLVLLAIAAVSLVLRLRRSRGEERLQVKWFCYVVAFVLVTFSVSVMVVGQGTLGVVLFPLIPIAAGISIFKYRLYDIDVVINRTLVYAALTAVLATTYLAIVLLLQFALDPVTSGSSLAVAVSTLAVAALFRPARTRIQATVDRRFYRRRYDAARTLERFATRLREQVDLEALGGELRGVVQETMQPAHVSLWLRGDG
jgi:hypothetical protein